MSWLRRLFGQPEPVMDGVTLFIWPDGKMAVQSGRMELTASAIARLQEALPEIQKQFLAGKPIVMDGYIRLVRA